MSDDFELLDPTEVVRDLHKVNRFYDRMRRKISIWAAKQGGEKGRLAAGIVLLAPDFLMLLLRLLKDKRVPVGKKAMLAGGIAYYLLPLDFLPELILGPVAYMDDLVLAVLIINNLLQTIDPEIVFSHWSGEDDLLAKLRRISDFAEQFLSKGVYSKLKTHFRKLGGN